MNHRALQALFNMGLIVASASCAASAKTPEHLPAASSLPPPKREPTDAERLVKRLKEMDWAPPRTLAPGVELLGFVRRTSTGPHCDEMPCPPAWAALAPRTGFVGIVEKAGKLVALSAENFTEVVGPVTSAELALMRVALAGHLLAACRGWGRDAIHCSAASAYRGAYDAEAEDGFYVAVMLGSARPTCPGNEQPIGRPLSAPLGFMRVTSDGVVARAPHAFAAHVMREQQRKNAQRCPERHMRGRAHAGWRDRAEAPITQLDYYVAAYREESAAVLAFERLADELARFGAPAALVARARRSASDERRHAALFWNEILALTESLRLEAPVIAPEPCPSSERSLEEMLLENAVEGCARETYAAVVATHQAACFPLTRLRPALTELARDEQRHAALAYDVHAWGILRLPPERRAVLEAARRITLAEMAKDAERPSAVALAMGEPEPSLAGRALEVIASRLSRRGRWSSVA